MPLAIVTANHVRVTCDACRETIADLCCKRDLAVAAKISAVPKFKRAGWHFDPNRRAKSVEEAERSGFGCWYCPTCARKTHL